MNVSFKKSLIIHERWDEYFEFGLVTLRSERVQFLVAHLHVGVDVDVWISEFEEEGVYGGWMVRVEIQQHVHVEHHEENQHNQKEAP